jgi:hypothetical protein
VGTLSFLTPAAGLVGIAGVLPVLVFLRRERRARAVRRALGVAEPSPGPARALVAALVAVPLLGGVAAAQPVLDRAEERRQRSDAELLFVLDTSRSMLAAAEPGGPTRIERARVAALELRKRFPEVPAGLASLTDRTLPHLFPTIDARSFALTLERSIGIERPPPAVSSTLATDLGSLAAAANQRFFSPKSRRRVLVVLTDGESDVPGPGLGTALGRAGVDTVLVQLHRPGERIYLTSAPEPAYRTDPDSPRRLVLLAATLGGAAFGEAERAAAAAHVRERLGDGPTGPRPQRDLLALMPWTMLAAVVPLALVLRRRNV